MKTRGERGNEGKGKSGKGEERGGGYRYQYDNGALHPIMMQFKSGISLQTSPAKF